MNLWHLFSTEEVYKLNTFLSGGLWCSDLGSIVGFGDDAEGSEVNGLFISCWHVAQSDPTEDAWRIFGGDGDGFAIRTTEKTLESYATSFSNSRIGARFGKVTYIPEGGKISDPALEVLGHHSKEQEVRFLLELKERDQEASELKRYIQMAVPEYCEGRRFSVPIKKLTLSQLADSEFAMILPIDAPRVFKEFLVGPKVTSQARESAVQALRFAGVNCIVRDSKHQP